MSASGSHIKAIVYALAGFSLWVLSDTCLKLTGDLGIPRYQQMVVSSIGGLALIYMVATFHSGPGKLKARKWRGLVILGILHLINFSFWLMALSNLPLANLYTVIFLSPMVVAILAATFLHEKIGWKHALAIVAGFIGVTIAVDPGSLIGNSSQWVSYAYVFASMITISVQMLALRILGQRETRECVAFYPRIIILAGGIVGGLFMGFTSMPWWAIALSLVSGAIGSLGWLFMAHAYRMAPAATVAPFQYSEIITGGLIGFLIWHDVPTAHLLFGAVIIIGSGIYIITHSRKSAAILKEEESHA